MTDQRPTLDEIRQDCEYSLYRSEKRRVLRRPDILDRDPAILPLLMVITVLCVMILLTR